MGLFSKKRKSISVDQLLSLPDKDIERLIKHRQVPYRTAKQLRRAAKEDRRMFEGERGIQALLAGLSGNVAASETKDSNYYNIPLKERVHPSEYERILHREAKRQGLI